MPNAHAHHYVPRMHLKRFATPANGRMVVVYDKEWKATRTGGVKGLACERDLYTLNCGTPKEDTGIEDEFLAKVDNDASTSLDALAGGVLEQRTREVLAVYFATLVLRNPRLIEAQRQHDARFYTEIYRRMYLFEPRFRAGVRSHFKTEAEFQECWKAAAPEHVAVTANKERTMCTGMSIVERISNAILGMSWTLLVSSGREMFILGDRPIFSCRPGMTGRSPVGLHTPGAETIIPVSSHACLVLSREPSQAFAWQNASGSQVLEANTRSAHAARRRFFATEVRQEWVDLANRFDKWDGKIDSFVAPNLDISLNLVDNHLFRPLLSEPVASVAASQ